jgi:hypothetical protein
MPQSTFIERSVTENFDYLYKDSTLAPLTRQYYYQQTLAVFLMLIHCAAFYLQQGRYFRKDCEFKLRFQKKWMNKFVYVGYSIHYGLKLPAEMYKLAIRQVQTLYSKTGFLFCLGGSFMLKRLLQVNPLAEIKLNFVHRIGILGFV